MLEKLMQCTFTDITPTAAIVNVHGLSKFDKNKQIA